MSRADANAAMRWASRASLALALTLLGLKLTAWLQSGSVAMLGSLADTSLDVLAALLTFLAIRVATTPADRQHRFGHGKAEALAGLFQSALILASSLLLLIQCVERLRTPQPVSAPELGIGVSIFAIIATLALVWFQKRVVAQTGSLAVETDRLHYSGDLYLNLAVIAALVLDAVFHVRGADAVFGIGIALSLAWSAYNAARQAIDMVMDRELPSDDRERIRRIVAQHPDTRGLHELRTRRSGISQFIQFHMWVEPQLTVKQAHEILDAVEAQLRVAFPHAEFLIHIDPEGHKDAPAHLSN
jgi:ferrous-iron efflux pump FieF